LVERKIKTSPKYVAAIMREINLQGISRNSKREYKKTSKYVLTATLHPQQAASY